jgi:hypothetical protein
MIKNSRINVSGADFFFGFCFFTFFTQNMSRTEYGFTVGRFPILLVVPELSCLSKKLLWEQCAAAAFL